MRRNIPGSGDLIKIRPRVANTMISRGRTAFISNHDGSVDPKQASEGLYIYDTRVLSRYEWTMNGKRPEFSCGSDMEQFTWMGYFIQTPENCKKTPAHECDPLQETVELRLSRSVGEGMHEDVNLSNHTQIETEVTLELHYEHAFVSLEEAKEHRKQHGKLKLKWSHPSSGVWEQMADYSAQHHYSHQGNKGTAHLHRGLRLRVENATSAPKHGDGTLRFRIRLKPHGQWHACLSWLAYVDDMLLPLAAQCPRMAANEWDERRAEFLASAASFSASHADDLSPVVNRVLERSRLDLADLRMYDRDSPRGIALAAGVPTYMEVFGRDLQAAGWQAALVSPAFLRGGLNVLGKLGATEMNDWRDAQPGRIPHEIHTDPLSVLNFRPLGLDYGGVTASLLLPITVSELWHWTGDLDSLRPYVDPCMNALKWADKYSLDQTNFYRYKTRSTQGVKNQGWKDSEDAIVYPDGSQVKAPLGTSETQAFVYVAKLHFSEVMWRLGHTHEARRLFTEAEELKKRFNEKFWMEDEGFYAMGIDSRGEIIRTIAGDAGHCLLAGIVDESHIKSTAARLLRDDMFSGWGIRTLSAENPAFNPFSYHRGSVWPVTNASFVLAFSRFGLHEEMNRVAKAMFEAASLFENDRLPEVFGGHQRTEEMMFPGMYTKADWPQAWSASAPFLVVQAMLGLYAYASAHLLFLDPHLPEWLPEITVENLRVGKATVTLRFTRDAKGRTEYAITNLEGPLHIIRQASPWSLTTGWAERTRDVVESLLPHKRAS